MYEPPNEFSEAIYPSRPRHRHRSRPGCRAHRRDPSNESPATKSRATDQNWDGLDQVLGGCDRLRTGSSNCRVEPLSVLNLARPRTADVTQGDMMAEGEFFCALCDPRATPALPWSRPPLLTSPLSRCLSRKASLGRNSGTTKALLWRTRTLVAHTWLLRTGSGAAPLRARVLGVALGRRTAAEKAGVGRAPLTTDHVGHGHPPHR